MGLNVILLGFFITGGVSATTFDAVTGFSSSNPSGPWAFGTGVTGASFTPMTVFTAGDAFGVTGLSTWQTPVSVNNVPAIASNISGTPIAASTVVFPTNALDVHPGPSTDSIVTFTTPTTGTYDITGFFELLDIAPTGVIASIYAGSTQLYTTGALTGPPANQSTFTPGGKDTFSLDTSLTAGEVISFGVNNDGDFNYDSTGFDATITSAAASTSTPEPCSMFLLLAGVGVYATTLRNARRRA
jgi:hypothetical protein